jgi:phosphonatase-like hydrolase
MKYGLVVFDLAGTTVKDNKDVHRVLQKTMRDHDVSISIDDANEVMGIPKPEAIRILLKDVYSDTAVTASWISVIHKDFVENMIRFYENDPMVGEKEGVSDTFRKLKSRGIKVALDTGFDRAITDTLLSRLGWAKDDLVDCSVTSDEVQRGRPFPDMIYSAMTKSGISNSRSVIKVGDTSSDIREGHAAECGMVVGITSGAFSAEALKKEKPHYLIHQVPELLTLL